MQYTSASDQKWLGGTRSETVATDAKNATSLSTVAYALNGTQYVSFSLVKRHPISKRLTSAQFHLFYISKEHQVKQKTYSNTTSLWQDGSLNKLNITAHNHTGKAVVQACWQGDFYGNDDVEAMPTATGQNNTVPYENRKSMNIWIPVDDSTYHQYAWFNGISEDWALVEEWQGKNAHAGVGCYSWGTGTTTYTMMVNKDKNMETWWKDTADNRTPTAEHPVYAWQNSTKAMIQGVYPSTSLGYTTYLYAQMADRSIKGHNVSYQAENTTIVNEDTFAITDPAGPVRGLGGTHLTATAYEEKEGDKKKWDSLYVFFQTEGDDITAAMRRMDGGEWSSAKLNIPDE